MLKGDAGQQRGGAPQDRGNRQRNDKGSSRGLGRCEPKQDMGVGDAKAGGQGGKGEEETEQICIE